MPAVRNAIQRLQNLAGQPIANQDNYEASPFSQVISLLHLTLPPQPPHAPIESPWPEPPGLEQALANFLRQTPRLQSELTLILKAGDLNCLESEPLSRVFHIPPIFFLECLANLEFEIKRRKRMTGTPKQLVASLAERTSNSQSSVNIYHLRVPEAELAGRFDL